MPAPVSRPHATASAARAARFQPARPDAAADARACARPRRLAIHAGRRAAILDSNLHLTLPDAL